MCIRWLINWSDSTKMHGATIRFIPHYLRTPWSRVCLEKLAGSQLVNKIPAFCGTRMFITAFTTAHQLSLSWANSIESIPPYPTSWRCILILSSHLRLCRPSGLFPRGFTTKRLYTPPPIRATCPAHLINSVLHCRHKAIRILLQLKSKINALIYFTSTDVLLGEARVIAYKLPSKSPLYFPDANRKWNRSIFRVKLPTIKFYEDPFSGYRLVHTDGRAQQV